MRLFNRLQRGEAKRSMADDLAARVEKAHALFEDSAAEAWQPGYQCGEPLGEGELEQLVGQLEAVGPSSPTASHRNAVVTEIERFRSGKWIDFLKNGIAGKVAVGETKYRNSEIVPELIELYRPLVGHALVVELQKVNDYMQALYEALGLYHAAYKKLRRLEGVLIFSDVPRELSTLLPSQSAREIGHRIDGHIEHLLLDEFQDTDPNQYAILKPFVAAIHGMPDDRGLVFCVGDLKQSIYGWRGGTPEIFGRVGEDFPALGWIDNDQSWRSSSVVLQAVNEVFGRLAENTVLCEKHRPTAERWQASFRTHTVAGAERPGYVELRQSDVDESVAMPDSPERSDDDMDGGMPGAAGSDPHLEFVATQVQRIKRDAPWASIGVLTRTKDAARRIIFALGRIGVAASAEGGSPISDDPAVSVILSALRFADHPTHSAAHFHVLNSPLAETVRLCGAEALAAAPAAAGIRRDLIEEGYTATISRWAGVLSPACDARGTQRLMQLIELVDGFGNAAGTRPGELADFVEAQLVEEPMPSPVRVMTIHKSKGLEFDCVVLPELHKKLLITPDLIYRRHPRTMEIERVARYPNETLRNLVPELRALHDGHCAQEVSEALCLLYVAMTRARHALHILTPAPKGSSLSLAAILRSALVGCGEAAVGASGPEPLFAHGDAQWYRHVEETQLAPAPVSETKRTIELPTEGSYLPRTWQRISPSELSGNTRTARQLLKLDDDEGRRYGTAIHALFAIYSWVGEDLPDHEVLLRAVHIAVPGASAERCEQYVGSFRGLLEKPAVHQALARPQVAEGETSELWQERRFSCVLGEAMVTGSFDRVHLIRRDRRVVCAEILDFKTDSGPDFGALEEHYLPQMESYRAALGHMLGLAPAAVAAKLVFVSAAVTAEV